MEYSRASRIAAAFFSGWRKRTVGAPAPQVDCVVRVSLAMRARRFRSLWHSVALGGHASHSAVLKHAMSSLVLTALITDVDVDVALKETGMGAEPRREQIVPGCPLTQHASPPSDRRAGTGRAADDVLDTFRTFGVRVAGPGQAGVRPCFVGHQWDRSLATTRSVLLFSSLI